MKTKDTEEQARSLQAKAISLQNRLMDLKERRDRGRIDEGRYTDLAGDVDRERIEILMQLRSIFGDKDKDLDRIINSAIGGAGSEEIAGDLVDLAKKKGFGAEIISQIEKHQGTIISWIVGIGIEIVRRAAI
jgi:hypothetical protein